MRYPNHLPKEGTIEFVAPSFGATREPYHTRFQNALSHFHALGYQTIIGPNVYASHGIGMAAKPASTAAEWTNAYLSDKSDVILSVGGGELMCTMLPFLDFERIKKADPKWFMGYSDNTHLTFLLPTLCDTAAIYSYCAPEFGQEPWHPSLNDTWKILTGETHTVSDYDGWEWEDLKSPENPLCSFHIDRPPEMKSCLWDGAPFSGRFIGGCLDVLVNIVGTRYDKVREFTERYKDDGIIWFLEACDLLPMDVYRALWHLTEAGWFQHAKGFLIGRPGNFEATFGDFNQEMAVKEALREFSVPILYHMDIGHLPPMMPIISGAYGTVRRKNEDPLHIEITFEEK